MCGRKAPGLDSFDTLRQELPSSLSEAAAQAAAAQLRFSVPRPLGDDPSLLTPLPDFAGAEPSVIVSNQLPGETAPRRTTLVMAPGGAPLLAAPAAPTMALGTHPDAPPVPGPPYVPHPGPPPPHAYGAPHGPYAPRPPISGRFRAAAPVRIPITPSPARIVFGVVLAAVALWLAVGFLPQYRERLSEDVRTAIGVGAGGLGLVAFALILTGILYRAQAEVRCRVCARPVIAWKGAFGLHCPLGPHHARVAWLTIVVTVAFWTAVVAGGIALLVWLG
ncbi:MAG TPA: hypothetical protein VFU21_00200 [Kofleriaceae bacterium]|nr:hypothetical protein [Kofleriaceae bacterium]